MYGQDLKKIIRKIEEKMFWVPEYFFAKHPYDRAPIRIMVNRFNNKERKRLGNELRARGFVVKYWTPAFKARLG